MNPYRGKTKDGEWAFGGRAMKWLIVLIMLFAGCQAPQQAVAPKRETFMERYQKNPERYYKILTGLHYRYRYMKAMQELEEGGE